MRQSPFPATTPSQKTLISNSKIRKALADHSDDGTQVRHIVHYLFKEDAATRSEAEMAAVLRPMGFEIDLSNCKDGIIAEEYREVASRDFDSLTQSLSDFANEQGWKYDGFECAVQATSKKSGGFLSGWSLKRLFGRT